MPPAGAAGPEVRQVGARLNAAVTVNAVNLHGVARLAVETPIAVIVLGEVTIDAMHAFLQMNVLEMHRLLELVRIVRRDGLSVLVEHLTVEIALVHRAVVPAMAMKIGELG